MEVSNVQYYNKFSLKLLEDALFAISVNKLDVKDRVFLLRTGERGFLQFNKAVAEDGSGWRSFMPYAEADAQSLGIIQKTTHPMAPNGGALKMVSPRFTEYVAPTGVHIKVEVDPMYDDTVRNKIQHHLGGVAESYRYDILYIGSEDQPNIQLAGLKNGSEFRGLMEA